MRLNQSGMRCALDLVGPGFGAYGTTGHSLQVIVAYGGGGLSSAAATLVAFVAQLLALLWYCGPTRQAKQSAW